MWWIDALVSDFQTPVPVWRVQLFRGAMGVAIAAKFLLSLQHGGYGRFDRGNFEYYRIERVHGRSGARLIAGIYRPLLILRLAPALLLLLGWQVRFSALACILGIAFEFVYETRRHTAFMMLCCGSLMLAGQPGSLLRLDPGISTANTFSQFAVVFITSQMYLSSAWIKLRSPQFRSGRALAQLFEFDSWVRPHQRFSEFSFPRWLVRQFGGNSSRAIARWRAISLATIATEAALPVGLLFGGSMASVAIVVGVGMHILFAFVMFRRIAPFSLATASSYICFFGT